MDIIKLLLVIAGISLIAYGYHLLGIAPDTALEEVMTRVKKGEASIILGGTCVVIAMIRKS